MCLLMAGGAGHGLVERETLVVKEDAPEFRAGVGGEIVAGRIG